MGEKNFNFDVSGGSSQINAGQEGGESTNITNNYGDGSTVAELFEPLVSFSKAHSLTWEQLKGDDEAANVVIDELAQESESPEVFLLSAASHAEAEVESPPTDDELAAETESWTNKFRAVLPGMVKMGLAFGEAALSTKVKSSATVSGCLAAIEVLKGMQG